MAAQKTGDIPGAEQLYLQSLAQDPSLEKSLNNLGVILMGRGQNGEARRNFLTAVRQNPAYADAYYNLACLSAREQSLPQALAFLRQAVHLDPTAGKYAKNDPDLAPLASMEEFKDLVQPVSSLSGTQSSK
ncbi:MAG: tetratricopeptide repeat protein [Thermodesulfobacteriota bacterium]